MNQNITILSCNQTQLSITMPCDQTKLSINHHHHQEVTG